MNLKHKDFKSVIASILDTTGITSEKEKKDASDTIEEQILFRAYKKMGKSITLEEFSQKVQSHSPQIIEPLKQSTQEVVKELLEAALASATPQEIKRFRKLQSAFK